MLAVHRHSLWQAVRGAHRERRRRRLEHP
jgi:hypothetical protein